MARAASSVTRRAGGRFLRFTRSLDTTDAAIQWGSGSPSGKTVGAKFAIRVVRRIRGTIIIMIPAVLVSDLGDQREAFSFGLADR